MDKKIRGGDNISKKPKGTETSITLDAGKATGVAKPGISCIGEICFNENGFVVKIPEDADPRCAERIAKDILRGDADIKFEIVPKAILKSKEEYLK